MQDIAAQFQQSPGAAGLNGSPVAAGRTRQVRFRVVGNIPGAATLDQASFFNRDTDTAIDANHQLATVTPSVARFSAAEVGAFYAHNPAQLANINIVGANSAAVISTMKMTTVRFTPDGEVLQEEVEANAFQTAGDFQDTRVQIPTQEVLDGYTFVRLINDSQNPAAQYSANFTFAPSVDRRLAVPQIGPKVIVSPK